MGNIKQEYKLNIQRKRRMQSSSYLSLFKCNLISIDISCRIRNYIVYNFIKGYKILWGIINMLLYNSKWFMNELLDIHKVNEFITVFECL